MNNIPDKLKRQLAANPEYYRCCLSGYSECGGRITWHHAVTFKGRQLQERWCILPTCERHHGIGAWMDHGTFDNEKLLWVALNRATEDEMLSISRVVNYPRERSRLNGKYGVYIAPTMESYPIPTCV